MQATHQESHKKKYIITKWLLGACVELTISQSFSPWVLSLCGRDYPSVQNIYPYNWSIIIFCMPLGNKAVPTASEFGFFLSKKGRVWAKFLTPLVCLEAVALNSLALTLPQSQEAGGRGKAALLQAFPSSTGSCTSGLSRNRMSVPSLYSQLAGTRKHAQIISWIWCDSLMHAEPPELETTFIHQQ